MASEFENYEKKIIGADPMAKVKIAGSPFSSDSVKVTNVEVSSSVGCEASTCYVELKFPHMNYAKTFKLPSDFADVKVGAKLEVSLGYVKESETEVVFKGFISSFELEVDSDAIATLTIQGMDAKMWMMTSRKTELKKEKHKYSEIVNNTCSAYSSKISGKSIKIKGESKFKADLYQHGESDYEFLCRIASLTGAMFFISLGKLYFVDATSFEKSQLQIVPHRSIYNVKVSASVWGIPKSVEVVSINQKDHTKLIKGKATQSQKVGSGKNAIALTTNISTPNAIRIVDNTLTSVEEAKFLAGAVYNQREINLVEASVRMIGYPKAKLGTKVTIKNFSDPINNDYVVTGIKHRCNFNLGTYETLLTLKTNRVNPQKKLPF